MTRQIVRYILRKRARGFTLIELLTVMAIIAILAGLVLALAGPANKMAARSRASAEIKALETACESYKADNGTYPDAAIQNGVIQTGSAAPSDTLDPRVSYNPSSSGSGSGSYAPASLELYMLLSNDWSTTGTGGGPAGGKNYLSDIKPDTLGRASMGAGVSSGNPVLYLSDPFGNCYGYSTANAVAVASGSTGNLPGYNPTFDLWCTSGLSSGTSASVSLQWIKNW